MTGGDGSGHPHNRGNIISFTLTLYPTTRPLHPPQVRSCPLSGLWKFLATSSMAWLSCMTAVSRHWT